MRHLLDQGVVGVSGDGQQPLQLVHVVAVVRGELHAMAFKRQLLSRTHCRILRHHCLQSIACRMFLLGDCPAQHRLQLCANVYPTTLCARMQHPQHASGRKPTHVGLQDGELVVQVEEVLVRRRCLLICVFCILGQLCDGGAQRGAPHVLPLQLRLQRCDALQPHKPTTSDVILLGCSLSVDA